MVRQSSVPRCESAPPKRCGVSMLARGGSLEVRKKSLALCSDASDSAPNNQQTSSPSIAKREREKHMNTSKLLHLTLTATAGLLAVAGFGATASAQTTPNTVILVHGAW